MNGDTAKRLLDSLLPPLPCPDISQLQQQIEQQRQQIQGLREALTASQRTVAVTQMELWRAGQMGSTLLEL